MDRWMKVGLAIVAAVIMLLLLWGCYTPTKPPFVYQYQWPQFWGRWRFETWSI